MPSSLFAATLCSEPQEGCSYVLIIQSGLSDDRKLSKLRRINIAAGQHKAHFFVRSDREASAEQRSYADRRRRFRYNLPLINDVVKRLLNGIFRDRNNLININDKYLFMWSPGT